MLNGSEIFEQQSFHFIPFRKVVLITGASTGLGLAVAKALIALNEYRLILTARASSHHRFTEAGILESDFVWIRDMDIVNYFQVTEVMNEIFSHFRGVDVLINNAGISESSTVEDADEVSRQQQLDVNYLAPFHLINTVLPNMRHQGSGKIINISSAGGFMSMPTMSSYSASKFALEGASEALWYEMKPWGVSMTLIIPGFIHSLGYLNTRQTRHSQFSSQDCEGIYYEQYCGMKKLIHFGMKWTKATNEIIAKKILKNIQQKRPPLRLFVTFEARLFHLMRRLLPSRAYHWMVYKMISLMKRRSRVPNDGSSPRQQGQP